GQLYGDEQSKRALPDTGDSAVLPPEPTLLARVKCALSRCSSGTRRSAPISRGSLLVLTCAPVPQRQHARINTAFRETDLLRGGVAGPGTRFRYPSCRTLVYLPGISLSCDSAGSVLFGWS